MDVLVSREVQLSTSWEVARKASSIWVMSLFVCDGFILKLESYLTELDRRWMSHPVSPSPEKQVVLRHQERDL